MCLSDEELNDIEDALATAAAEGKVRCSPKPRRVGSPPVAATSTAKRLAATAGASRPPDLLSPSGSGRGGGTSPSVTNYSGKASATQIPLSQPPLKKAAQQQVVHRGRKSCELVTSEIDGQQEQVSKAADWTDAEMNRLLTLVRRTGTVDWASKADALGTLSVNKFTAAIYTR